jgi:hypothetical protein
LYLRLGFPLWCWRSSASGLVFKGEIKGLELLRIENETQLQNAFALRRHDMAWHLLIINIELTNPILLDLTSAPFRSNAPTSSFPIDNCSAFLCAWHGKLAIIGDASKSNFNPFLTTLRIHGSAEINSQPWN